MKKTLSYRVDLFNIAIRDQVKESIDRAYTEGYHEGRDQLITWLVNNGYKVPLQMRQLSSIAFSQLMGKDQDL